MNLNLENGWRILPIGGDTNTAYMGIKSNQKIFLKRNTSPFLAALSLEGITPKLIWTKRITTGDTLTAQEWLNGRSLNKNEMTNIEVSKLLYKVHHTPVLKKMLFQIGGKVVTPSDLLKEYSKNLSDDLRKHSLLNQVVRFLKTKLPRLKQESFEVCHGDLNHKNWLLSDENKLYLVDWESARIADPASDLSMLMCQYVPRENWEQWLHQYGLNVDETLLYRIYWYSLINLLLNIKYNHQRGRFIEMNQDILKISELVENYK